ncbi:acylphosphatase [Mesorhizobium xinjiangense]|uniref:acylphosphatase n=1 Tax=Mesorhizobium xinjiangense TaxID=2678685 RepID=UPI0018DE71A1|nr:acylphosphatase [Mesorhizobium xinjiangense]
MDYLTGDLGKGGAHKCAIELRFEGKLGEAFVAFAVARAQRLCLSGWVEVRGADAVTVVAEGPEALVDAFEISCSLGPIEAHVERWVRADRNIGLNLNTFKRRG